MGTLAKYIFFIWDSTFFIFFINTRNTEYGVAEHSLRNPDLEIHLFFGSIGPIMRAVINEYCLAFIITVLCQAGPNNSYDEFTKFVEDTATKSLNRSYLIISALFLHNEWICRNLYRGVLTLKLFFSNICATTHLLFICRLTDAKY